MILKRTVDKKDRSSELNIVMFHRRTIDAVVIGYAKQTLSFFLVDLDLIMDVVVTDSRTLEWN